MFEKFKALLVEQLNVKASEITMDAELSNGANWVLVHSGEAEENDRSYIAHKAIPIARILSRG